MPPVQSPCTNVCVIDPVTRLCRGCARTLDEIAEWGMASEARKEKILADIAQRRAQASTAVTK